MCQAKFRYCEYCKHTQQTAILPCHWHYAQHQLYMTNRLGYEPALCPNPDRVFAPYTVGACPGMLEGCPSFRLWAEKDRSEQLEQHIAARQIEAAEVAKEKWCKSNFVKRESPKPTVCRVSFMEMIKADALKQREERLKGDDGANGVLETSASVEVDHGTPAESKVSPIPSIADDLTVENESAGATAHISEHGNVNNKADALPANVMNNTEHGSKKGFGLRNFGSKIKLGLKKVIKKLTSFNKKSPTSASKKQAAPQPSVTQRKDLTGSIAFCSTQDHPGLPFTIAADGTTKMYPFLPQGPEAQPEGALPLNIGPILDDFEKDVKAREQKKDGEGKRQGMLEKLQIERVEHRKIVAVNALPLPLEIDGDALSIDDEDGGAPIETQIAETIEFIKSYSVSQDELAASDDRSDSNDGVSPMAVPESLVDRVAAEEVFKCVKPQATPLIVIYDDFPGQGYTPEVACGGVDAFLAGGTSMDEDMLRGDGEAGERESGLVLGMWESFIFGDEEEHRHPCKHDSDSEEEGEPSLTTSCTESDGDEQSSPMTSYPHSSCELEPEPLRSVTPKPIPVGIWRWGYAELELEHPRPFRNLNPVFGFDMNGEVDYDADEEVEVREVSDGRWDIATEFRRVRGMSPPKESSELRKLYNLPPPVQDMDSEEDSLAECF